MPDQQQSSRIPTNLRTLRILEVLGRSDKVMTPTEINDGIGLPKQTIHRLCTTLIEEGYLVRDTSGKGLRPSRRLRDMAAGILNTSHSHIARHQILQQVADRVSETVNFVVPADQGMTYLDRVETDWPFRVQLPIGTCVPFHCTASGKAFLASLNKSAREKMVQSLALEQRTPNTIVTPDHMLRELDKVAQQGCALDNEEFIEGMVAIAVPVLDESGRYAASLAFHGPTPRLTIDRALAQKEMLQEAAEKLNTCLFT